MIENELGAVLQVLSQAIVTSRLNNDLNNAKHVSNIEKGREMK